MYFTATLMGLVFASTLNNVHAAAPLTCSGQQYNDIPGFPAQNSACYPTNYYRTSDLGQTSPDDAKTRCQQQCTADSSCNSVVAQVNKAADSNLYSGTCFFYARGQTVSPRRCADTAYLLEGYMKDATLDCFSSSLSSASRFCSSYLGIPSVTQTKTSTPAVVSTTTTVTTTPVTTTTSTIIVTPYSTITTTTITTLTVTTSTVTATNTVPSTTVATVTSTVTAIATKGARKRTVNTIPPPACVTSGTPASRISAACSCLNVSTGTTTSTKTLTPTTTTLTSTSTVSSTATLSVTTSAGTVTTTITATATNRVTATTTTTTTTTVPVVIATTATITTTSTTTLPPTTTSTTTTTAAPSPTCAGGSQEGAGQVIEGCQDGTTCTSPSTCTVASSDDDCNNRCGSACIAYSYHFSNGDCVAYTGCCPEDPKRRRMMRARHDMFEELVHRQETTRRNLNFTAKKPGVTFKGE